MSCPPAPYWCIMAEVLIHPGIDTLHLRILAHMLHDALVLLLDHGRRPARPSGIVSSTIVCPLNCSAQAGS